MQQLTESGCVKIANWYLNENGHVRLDYPASIFGIPGVLVIANSNEVLYIGATKHYGPRIKDFVHSVNGDTANTRIHNHIVAYLDAGNTDLMLWRKDDPDPHVAKTELKALFSSKWSG